MLTATKVEYTHPPHFYPGDPVLPRRQGTMLTKPVLSRYPGQRSSKFLFLVNRVTRVPCTSSNTRSMKRISLELSTLPLDGKYHKSVIFILFIVVALFHFHHNAPSCMTLGFDCIAENNVSVTNHDQKRSDVPLAPLHTPREIHELAFEVNVRRTDSTCVFVQFWVFVANVQAGQSFGGSLAILRHKPSHCSNLALFCKYVSRPDMH
ncbi:hypothetical protein DFJ58DRAFT_802821 [Suillus subalutaceus]|uniref:uncharacterized protein n=1 Tax=Suillus subalutaceus TaxID=48586 RepID=UPI001B864BC9|nr:uncharacterized protein DFJ58DRAFT_802821 [Suillus subalutaceus]KAG1844330.1 hypothetical protein DFJ58DRAFT_802821 [Suillus subalutaceus]